MLSVNSIYSKKQQIEGFSEESNNAFFSINETPQAVKHFIIHMF